MRKRDSNKEARLHIKRERKRQKRIRNSNSLPFKKRGYLEKFQIKSDKKRIESFEIDVQSPFFAYLKRQDFFRKINRTYFLAPKEIDFFENYERTLKFIQKIISSKINNVDSRVTIDFSLCKKASQTPLFLLKIILDKIDNEYERMNSKLQVLRISNKVEVKGYKARNVRLNLFLSELIKEVDLDREGQVPLMSTRYIQGNSYRKGVLYNLKGSICRKVVSFMNEVLKQHSFELSSDGRHKLDGLISEVLSNAEDHGKLNEYYVMANFSTNRDSDSENEIVGEANIFIMNFGPSIYERLIETGDENREIIDDLDQITNVILKKVNKFRTSDLYTLYSLQHGISRLKYVDESRGTGTMKFLRAFFDLGDYEDKGKNFIPRISLISGSTGIYIENNHAPYFDTNKNQWYVSLNKEQDLRMPPSDDSLFKLETIFPGTLLSARIFFNTNHMLRKVEGGGKNERENN
ncbi:MAG: hypothetical protein ABJH08_12720 [Balneola sp.]